MTNKIAMVSKPLAISKEERREGIGALRVQQVFRWIVRSILLMGALSSVYWIFSSDRYVSESIVLIQNTEQIGVPSFDITTVLGGIGSISKPDQLLLREHLLSVDMLKKLDAALNLRAHYSDRRHDFGSRMWFKDASIEWFHRHYLSRVTVDFDDYAGVLRIRVQAYDAAMAQAIALMLVKEGERYMNEMSHALARAQVEFLDTQVASAHEQLLKASQILLDFQNQKGLVSPKATVGSIYSIIGKLEGQRTELQTQLASLPRNLDRNHPTRKSLEQSLLAVERQIAQEHAKLASTSGMPLNSLVEEEQRLEMDLEFKKAVYKTALAGLEKGRMDAARTLKQVSVLQMPVLSEYAMEPRRIYGVVATVCITVLLIGIMNLLKSVILDHVD
ncbi:MULTISPECIES: chain-length determining protein [Desulfovibrio]|uniref:Capsular polysaccharide transport system permease protein n=1 Tax=Desulfovibrio desulfuricans TaxID=876 RepID=A0AA94L302_DESDE|nr:MULTISPECIES: chain-length determining protein [Desulfovibrio]SFW64427.1 capsular polysaccharide transport system permease protein [Desulfovibrio desulfuricans]SPD36495.1 Hypothetical protein DSVG11_2453 [Desulfovibrio sp. G11]